ncbi:MAG: hypothetical protein ABL964_10190 [Steroidobacteraceae bacterium]
MPADSSLRTRLRGYALWLSLAFCIATAWGAETGGSTPAATPAVRTPSFLLSQPTTLTYDTEYPALGYSGVATENAVARLQARLDRGEVKLAYKEGRGYLDSLLGLLGIDASSQSLVFSRTSFQVAGIRAASPRAIYFNDDTYVAWIPGGEMLEMGTMDTRLGPVFYTLPNQVTAPQRFDRPILTCISCHDSLTLTGGGVPRFILGSGYVGINGEQLTHEGRILTTDRTPLRSRWGGWYVTGTHGDQVHLGNILVRSANELVDLDNLRRGNLENLDALFDTRPYLSNKSDIVALLVFQHQMHMQNLISRVNFEVREALARAGKAGDGSDKGAVELTPDVQMQLQEYLDDLVNGMLFVNAAGYTGKITGNSGFDRWFEARGPRDKQGRSLRKLDLTTRLFAYPLSYAVYSEAFDALPAYAKNYVYGRFASVLSGQDESASYAHLAAADRKSVQEILVATKPDYAQFTARSRSRTTK